MNQAFYLIPTHFICKTGQRTTGLGMTLNTDSFEESLGVIWMIIFQQVPV